MNQLDKYIEENTILELYLLIIYLTSWEEQKKSNYRKKSSDEVETVVRCWKGFRFEYLESLETQRYIYQIPGGKSMLMLDKGIALAEKLMQRYFPFISRVERRAALKKDLPGDCFCSENALQIAQSLNFHLDEFKCKDGTEVPIKFRGNIQMLMYNLEILRQNLANAPVHILSGYRTDEYNRDVEYKDKQDKVLQSFHVCGMAADIAVDRHPPKKVYDKIVELIENNLMLQGGVALHDTFVHYDIGGTKVRWK